MYTDARTIFSDAQTVAGTDETVLSTNIIDLGLVPTLKSLGFDQCYVNISTAVADELGGDIEIRIVSASATNLSTGQKVHWSSGLMLAADTRLDVGQLIECVPLPVGANYGRYLGIIFIITNSTDTLGINAHVTPHSVVNTHYPDAI